MLVLAMKSAMPYYCHRHAAMLATLFKRYAYSLAISHCYADTPAPITPPYGHYAILPYGIDTLFSLRHITLIFHASAIDDIVADATITRYAMLISYADTPLHGYWPLRYPIERYAERLQPWLDY